MSFPDCLLFLIFRMSSLPYPEGASAQDVLLLFSQYHREFVKHRIAEVQAQTSKKWYRSAYAVVKDGKSQVYNRSLPYCLIRSSLGQWNTCTDTNFVEDMYTDLCIRYFIESCTMILYFGYIIINRVFFFIFLIHLYLI